MRFEIVNSKGKEIKVVPESLDDLWHLYNIIRPGDLVFGYTLRRLSERQDVSRSRKKEVVRVRLGIRVEDVEFHEFSSTLRVKGRIEYGLDEGLGKYHTISVRVGDEITIIKEEWLEEDLKRLRDAERASKRPRAIFVSLDDSEATVAVLTQRSIEVIGEAYRHGTKETEWGEKEFYGEILSMLDNVYEGNNPIIIVGPGVAKEGFIKFLRERRPDVKFKTVDTAHAGIPGIREAINRGLIEEIVREERVCFEMKKVEDYMAGILKGEPIAYGRENVLKALDYGAVEELLITDELARTEEGIEIIKKAESYRARVTIISTTHEGGIRLKGFGGIMAKLRFPI